MLQLRPGTAKINRLKKLKKKKKGGEFQNHTNLDLSSALPLSCVLGQITQPLSLNFLMCGMELIISLGSPGDPVVRTLLFH